MTYNPQIHQRQSIRLKGYDYSQDGVYFLTICTDDRRCLFGDVVGGKMCLNDGGEIVKKCWNEIPEHYPFVRLDEYVVMPNHVHGILFIYHALSVGANNHSPLPANNHSPLPNVPIDDPANNHSPLPNGTSKTIGAIVRGFKIGVTKWYRNIGGDENFIAHTISTPTITVWQRNYYEHIVRDDEDLNRIRYYIVNNPEQWELDRNNPKNI